MDRILKYNDIQSYHEITDLTRSQTSGNTYNCAVRSAPGNVETSGHVGASNGFDFLYRLEGRMRQKLIKVADDLVEQLQAFQSLLVEVVLGVKTFFLCHRRSGKLMLVLIT